MAHQTIMEAGFCNYGELKAALRAADEILTYFHVDARDVTIVSLENTGQPTARVRLIEETLTDESKVYSISIRS